MSAVHTHSNLVECVAESTQAPSSSSIAAPSRPKENFQYNHLYGVTVKIFSAADLVRADAFGLSDPFVILEIDGQRRKTQVIKNTLNPAWNESFDFLFTSVPQVLKMECWDWDNVGSNDPLGVCSVTLGSSAPFVRDEWVPLSNVKSGSIHVRIELSLIEQVVGRTSALETEEEVSAIEDLENLIDLKLIEGSSLKSHDLFSKCDPFAVVSFGLHAFRTPVLPDTDTPQWNQLCPFWTTNGTRDYVIKISVYDHDRFSKSKFIGNAFLKPSQLKLLKEYDFWLPLLGDDPQTDAELSHTMSSLEFDPENPPTFPFNQPNIRGSIHVTIKVTPRQQVQENFYDHLMSTYDTDNSGTIDSDELVHMLHTIGVRASDEVINEAFKDADANKSGSLNRQGLALIFSNNKLVYPDILRKLHTVMLHGEDALHQLMMKGCLCDVDVSLKQDADEEDEVDNSGVKIFIQDRSTGMLVKENIPTYIKSALRLLYRTKGGKALNSRIASTMRSLTIKAGKKMDNPKSSKDIPGFIRTHNLKVDEIELPLEEYKTFNQFFYRKLKAGARICDAPDDDNVVVSPADCRMMVFDSIEESRALWIKGENFSLGNLFGEWDLDGSKTALFNGGALVIARLAPQDYHRWHFPVTGVVGKRFPIDGDFNTVNPIAIRKNIDVYTSNRRVICPIQTKEFGLVVLIAVGATMVGSINFNDCACADGSSPPNNKGCQGACVEGKLFHKFDQHGYFAFGGSTTLVLFQPGAIAFDKDIKQNSNNQLETLVKVGNRIAVSTGKYNKP